MDPSVHRQVKKKVKAKKGFLGHLGAFISVGIFFVIINIATWNNNDGLWFFWPMLPWGVGLMIHYFSVFGLPGQSRLVEKWEAEEMARALQEYREIEGRPSLPASEDIELPKTLKRHKEKEEEKLPNYDEGDFV